jgi:hypothetical protein
MVGVNAPGRRVRSPDTSMSAPQSRRARALAERALAEASAGSYGYIERDASGVLTRLQ